MPLINLTETDCFHPSLEIFPMFCSHIYHGVSEIGGQGKKHQNKTDTEENTSSTLRTLPFTVLLTRIGLPGTRKERKSGVSKLERS